MKNFKISKVALSAIAAATLLSSCGAQSNNSKPTLRNQSDSASYALGILMGNNISGQIKPILKDFDYNIFASALQAATSKNPPSDLMSREKAGEIFNKIMFQSQQEANAKELEKGRKFLAENAKKEGVVTLPNGIQYIELEKGNDQHPTIDDNVECDYVGTLIDGTEFDSSIKRGQPAQFPLRGVIKGWQETIPLMGVGSKWKIFIPAELGYGERNTQLIPGNSVLIFEVTLHNIIKNENQNEDK